MAHSAPPDEVAEVIVVGAGIAGLTAAIVLARGGVGVVCVEPAAPPRERVGESLDWAAPALLDRVGLPTGRLVGERMGTWKREVHGVATSGRRMVGRPPAWMSRWPLRFSPETVHVDRRILDTALFELAASAGVRFIWDAVIRLDADGDRVTGCWTRTRQRLTARWFLDASGRARLFARALGIDRRAHGLGRTALWAQRRALPRVAGTVLHLDDGPEDLRWAWEIPLSPDRQSIGVVLPDAEFRERRRRGTEPSTILHDVLAGFPVIPRPEAGDLHGVGVRAVRCFVHERVSGANWMMIGDAAAVVDPLTSSGVSTAMRHGIEAAEIIRCRFGSPENARRAIRRFDRRVRGVAKLYNEAIEELLYSPAVRREVGIRWAARAYVILGFGASVLYGRIGGIGPVRHAAVVGVAGCCRVWLRGWLWAAAMRRYAGSLRRRHLPRSEPFVAAGEGYR